MDCDSDCKCPQVASVSTPPSPVPIVGLDLAQSLDTRQQAPTSWAEKSRLISAWTHSVPATCPSNESYEPLPIEAAPVPDTMSESSSLRSRKRNARSCSPEYRNTVLKPANILIDVTHSLPPEIEALLPSDLRDILGAPSPFLLTRVGDTVAKVYWKECCELAQKPGSEPEYRGHLHNDVVEKLARILPWRCILSDNCSDKLWCTDLKPPAPTSILSLPWLPLSANRIVTKPQDGMLVQPTQNSLDSDIIRVQPGGNAVNFMFPRAPTEPSESSTPSELDGTITTPKPDITVGISRQAFGPTHTSLLDYWQASKAVLSDPHAIQGDMRFPFLIIETKGLATSGNILGAQNQAAGAGTCAIRLLRSLADQDPGTGAPRIVFSCTTEGAIHELWIHYQAVDEGGVVKQHMTCLGIWRTTFESHANAFVAALASIYCWGVNVFFPQIQQVLDRYLDVAVQQQGNNEREAYDL
ncbi:hypothetical protein GQ44DRAFT_758483 [Phaeosphaeriaceae sp. PMI808]|nr:hypothetical protein GQ44DRAFT_758483 [Phaeosphaeriaceae sp. PMI808]